MTHLPKKSLLCTKPSVSRVETVKFLDDSIEIGCPRRDFILDANRESNTRACPSNCSPPGTMRS